MTDDGTFVHPYKAITTREIPHAITARNHHIRCQITVQFGRNIASERIAVITHIPTLENTVFIIVAETEEVFHNLIATLNRQVMIMSQTGFFHGFIVPVRAFITRSASSPLI